jgi:uncharacterized membrane protein YcjF (UPF0283 family)
LTFELAEKSAIGKVEGRWLRLFVAAMGALAIFAPAGRLVRYALDLMRLTQPPLQRARSCIVASPAKVALGYGALEAAYDRCVGRISDFCAKTKNGVGPRF